MLKYTMSLAKVFLVGTTTAVLAAAISVSHNQRTTFVTTAVQEMPVSAIATAAAREAPPPAAAPAPAAAQETPAPASATAAAQQTPEPSAVKTTIQEPAPVSAEDIKLTVAPKPKSDVAPSAEPQRVDLPAALASTPAPVEKRAAEKRVAKKTAAEKPAVAAAKRAKVAARQH